MTQLRFGTSSLEEVLAAVELVKPAILEEVEERFDLVGGCIQRILDDDQVTVKADIINSLNKVTSANISLLLSDVGSSYDISIDMLRAIHCPDPWNDININVMLISRYIRRALNS